MKVTIDTENRTVTILDQSFKFKELVNFITDFDLQDYTIDNTATPYWTVTSTPTIFNGPTIKEYTGDNVRSGYLSTTGIVDPKKY